MSYPSKEFQDAKSYIDSQFDLDYPDMDYKTKGAVEKYVPCHHAPTLVIDYKGLKVSVGKRFDVTDKMGDYDVVLNMTGTGEKREHLIPIPALQKWSAFPRVEEIVLNWPDYGVINFPVEFWDDLTSSTVERGGKLLIFCVGGHGRTGTALAALLITQLGYAGEDAIEWVRHNYCGRAIESDSQERYLKALARETLKVRTAANRRTKKK